MRTLDDFFPGQTFTAGPEEVTREEVISFAQRYDPQYFHLDDTTARDSLFGGLAASGWLTAALTMRMMVASRIDILGGMIGREIESLRWPRPVYPGDSLRTITTILEVLPSRNKPDRGTLRWRTETLNQKDEPVQVMTCAVFVPRLPGSETPAQD